MSLLSILMGIIKHGIEIENFRHETAASVHSDGMPSSRTAIFYSLPSIIPSWHNSKLLELLLVVIFHVILSLFCRHYPSKSFSGACDRRTMPVLQEGLEVSSVEQISDSKTRLAK